jgi:hypothetical protein
LATFGVLIARFDELIHDAKAIPLTRDVRVPRDDANGLVSQMQNAATPQTAELVERLAEMVHAAKAVPLTDWIRINREEAYAVCDEIRLALKDDQVPDEPAVP